MQVTTQLRAKREALAELWEKGLLGHALLKAQSGIADEFIRTCFDKPELDAYRDSVALVALGGYGRTELYPFSDIDIMILFREDLGDDVGKVVDAILYPLWDTGLEVGHGVRTVEQSMVHAREDFFFRVALIDARFIAGSQELFSELQAEYQREYVDGKREEFVMTMHAFREERREKYGSHSYLLEPHIKEGKGGLRDVQAMMWIARVVFGLDGLDSIADAGLLTPDERKDFEESWNMLVQLRNRLHYFSKRKNDQLYFELQEEMAEAFGYSPTTGVLGVENFMREVYAHLQKVAMVTDLFFNHVDEVLGTGLWSHECFADKVIEKGIEIRKNRLHLVATRSELEKKPHMLMRLFLAAARTGAPIHHRTFRSIASNIDLVDEKLRRSSRMSKAFQAVLLEAENPFPVLEVMLETGLLQAYLPEFSKIDTLAQYDIYHIYTVDRHSLQAVAELKKVIDEEVVASSQLDDGINVLFLAALLHDIGKGSGKDHSEYGADLVAEIGKRLHLTEKEIELTTFLVRYHLYIPENALRRDLEDTVFIRKCAMEIGSRERLAMLYLLSVADSRATGPSAWSEWKAHLMLELFLKVQPFYDKAGLGLEPGRGLDTHAEEGVGWLREKVQQQLGDNEELNRQLEMLPSDYLVSFAPELVADHIRIFHENQQIVQERVLILPTEKDGKNWSILVMSRDKAGLLAKICGVMALHNLSVVNAQIFTWHDGTAVDVIDVTSIDGLGFIEKDWSRLADDLDRAIDGRLGLSHRLYQKLSSSYRRHQELSSGKPTEVKIDNDSSREYTVVEVYAQDLPGQLYHITQALADFGISIHKAFIATEVERLIDAFYVQDSRGEKIVDRDFQHEVVQGLLYSVDHLAKR